MVKGSHCLRSWSLTQKFVTLSTAEAELMAAVRAATEGIGMTQLAESLGVQMIARILIDSSAALAVVSRKGNGRLRHVKIGHLWIQEAAAKEEVILAKVRGSENPADLMTKHLQAAASKKLCELLGQLPRDGQAQCRLHLNTLTCITGVALRDIARTLCRATCSKEQEPEEECLNLGAIYASITQNRIQDTAGILVQSQNKLRSDTLFAIARCSGGYVFTSNRIIGVYW